MPSRNRERRVTFSSAADRSASVSSTFRPRMLTSIWSEVYVSAGLAAEDPLQEGAGHLLAGRQRLGAQAGPAPRHGFGANPRARVEPAVHSGEYGVRHHS